MTVKLSEHEQKPLDADLPSTCFYHDWEDESDLSSTIVTAVSEITGQSETSVERIYNRVDPDSLNALFTHTSAKNPRSDGLVSFTLDGCEVAIYASGFVFVQCRET